MIVTGYYHNGKIEIPKKYHNLKENTRVKVAIPQKSESKTSLHPYVAKLVRSLEKDLKSSNTYTAVENKDKD